MDYLLWWSALNFGAATTNKTTISHKGPGRDTKETMQVFYDQNSFILTWIFEVEHTRSGVFKSFVKISGAGNSKTRGGCFAP